ncbi:hypothetical protein N7450_010422 [Penicillium hetheringtonii]|uniref:Uncharacterized protein n=1 Tax=Penicillium hetheringtonii TaxID=911720 RepID=A0AAD6GK12_9EURO|nr:hypothetical protein N7450_010422 [Penicillium hetheringtonii]
MGRQLQFRELCHGNGHGQSLASNFYTLKILPILKILDTKDTKDPISSMDRTNPVTTSQSKHQEIAASPDNVAGVSMQEELEDDGIE